MSVQVAKTGGGTLYMNSLGQARAMYHANAITKQGWQTAKQHFGQPNATAHHHPVQYDVNGDGSVNVGDVQALKHKINAGASNRKYDFNHDGKVNISDVQKLFAEIQNGNIPASAGSSSGSSSSGGSSSSSGGGGGGGTLVSSGGSSSSTTSTSSKKSAIAAFKKKYPNANPSGSNGVPAVISPSPKSSAPGLNPQSSSSSSSPSSSSSSSSSGGMLGGLLGGSSGGLGGSTGMLVLGALALGAGYLYVEGDL